MPAQQATVKTKAITCPGCGGTVKLRGFAHTLSVTCTNCRTVLDTSSPEVSILSRAQKQMKVEPHIPLGSRGTFDGLQYEAIGFEQRYIQADGENFFWQEYVLFHPFKGFRYLSEYNGHWTFIQGTEVLPGGLVNRSYDGHVFRPFQRAIARTGFVIGEFPWRVSIGEAVNMSDHVSPPYILSREANANEVTWSYGRYIPGDEIWKACNVPGAPPKAEGIYANQPNPHQGKPGAAWKLFFLFLAIAFMIMVVFGMSHKSEPAFTGSFTFDPTSQTDQSAVSEPFELSGSHTFAVHVESRAAVQQNWIYLAMSLVNVDTNISYDFSEMLSYYSGVDGGESWSEGSKNNSTTVHRVPPGKYYLRIDPEREKEAGESAAAAARPISYQVAVFQGANNIGLFFIVILLLLPVPIISWWRYAQFETKRWSESDLTGAS